MKYMAEVWHNNRIVFSGQYTRMSHPEQVVRSIASDFKGVLNIYIIYVMNEKSNYWCFSVKLVNGKYRVSHMNVPDVLVDKDDIDMVFSSNMSIREVINNG